MKVNNILMFFFLFPAVTSIAQKGQKKTVKEGEQKYNRTGKDGTPQGYWKNLLPDGLEHFSNYEEGLYYNGKKIGVWYKKNYQQKKYEMEIYFDTSQNQIEHFGYYLKSEALKEHGYYLLTAMGKTNSVEYKDPVTNKKKLITWDNTNMKQGKWTFYYESGQIESEGLYKDDKKKGEWKYYSDKGVLLKQEEF